MAMTTVGPSCGTRASTEPPPLSGRGKRVRSALFAVVFLAVTLLVLTGIYLLVREPVKPAAYPGLRGFPKVGSVPSKSAGDVVTFVFAFLVGFLIQRSRWCNASAVRDAILFKSFRNTKPLLAAMMVITAMFTIFESIHVGTPISIVGGAFTVLGLFLFGIGMVLGGACTVSVWVRSAEGSFAALWALLYTFIGMFGFSEVWNVLRWPAANYLQSASPNLSILSFGSFNALSIGAYFGSTWGPVMILVAGFTQVILLGLLYRHLTKIERVARTQGVAAAVAAAPVTAALLSGPSVEPTAVAPGATEEGGRGVAASGIAVLEHDDAPSSPPNAAAAAGGDGAEAPTGTEHFVTLPQGLTAVDRVLDCSGEMCPRPQLFTKREVTRQMHVGQVLELVVDNPSSPELIPSIMQDIGAVHLGTVREDGVWKLYIRKDRESVSKRGGRS